ncbi:site-specific integrase [Flavobacterium sp. UBA7682]|uniref:site-specific integrase n=1 Tax=Flavobacterium sp. UBA7682 TaxID=1946560 RepID=UPI0025C425EE|nr:site-specific integrase [Flavobacterium sp. UBA7682]
MKHKLSTLFYIKSSKSAKNGLIPIYLRVTINGVRIEFSTSKFIESSKWNSISGRLKGNSEETRSLNSYLDILKCKVNEVEKDMVNNNIEIDARSFKNKFLGVEEKQRMLITIFENHNNNMKDLVGKDFANNTYKRYLTSLSHTKEFLKYKYNLNDISIINIDLAFINDYDFYLRSIKKCNNNSTIKYIRNFGKIVKQCCANGWLDKDPFANYRGKVKHIERIYLNEVDIQSLITKNLKSERLSLVRDIFLFSCFTGLAYIDVRNLTKFHISIGIDGEKWIFTHRQKTESASKIPILPVTQIIIDKYENHPTCLNENRLLPILSNQKMNAYLKEIADLCEIEKDLTFHIARHTFATTVTLSNGVPIESVSKMLGHKDLRTTQHYAKILDRKVSDDMAILKQKLSTKIMAQSS